MEIITAIVIATISVLVTLYLQKLKRRENNKIVKQSFIKQINENKSKDKDDKLSEHSSEFDKKEILKVLDNIYVAIGYGLANCIMVVGDDGVVIIDTMESPDTAQEVLAEFKKITQKPIVGIILTHFHADHTNGINVFLEAAPDNVEIFTHDSFPKYLSQVMNVRSQITYKRAVRQFGTEIPKEALKNAGIGLNLKLDKAQGFAGVTPTKVFSQRLAVNLAGLELELIHAPGETDDQIIVWYPCKKVLFPADNIYKAFPNLYAIRGTMHRDTLQWVAALDIMLDLSPSHLVPQHTRPLHGEETIRGIVTAYRDAIQYVHDQTVRYMNKGLTGNQIAEVVKLPPHLQSHPYLIEYYGTVEWSVKAVYNGYIGWFSGRPAELHPLPVRDEARMMVQLAGGREVLMEKIKSAVESRQFQWGLKLSDFIIDSEVETDLDKELVLMRSQCLQELSSKEVSAPGRNWYLTEDLVMRGLIVKPSQEAKASRIKSGDIKSLFNMLTCMLDATSTADVTTSSLFIFTDTDVKLSVVIRRGVCVVADYKETDKEEVDMKVVCKEAVWRDIMAKERSPVAAHMTGELSVSSGITSLGTFFGYFDTEV